MRIMFAAHYCYLDDSNGATRATRAMIEALARNGVEVEAFSGTTLGIDDDVEFEDWLSIRRPDCRQPHEEAGPSITGSGAATEGRSGFDRLAFRLNGVPITIARGAAKSPLAGHDADSPAMLSALADTLERFSPDIVVTFGGDSTSASVRKICKRYNCKIVFGLHNFNYQDISIFDEVDQIFVPSRFSADYHLEKFGLECTHLPNLVDVGQVRAEFREPRYITFVNPSYEKGVYAFARIADELGRRRPDIALLVVEGRGSERTVADCGLNLVEHGNVFFMSHTPRPSQFWSVTRACIMPSLWWESQPLVVVEAMLNGIPVIGSDRGGIPETLNGSGIVLSLPERLTPYTRELPTAEEVSPWVEASIRIWDDDIFYGRLCDGATSSSKVWAASRIEAMHLEYFTKIYKSKNNCIN